MERAYLQGTLYAFVLVGGLTFWMLRRVRESLLALVPLALGLLWTVGLMRLFDLKFNLANVWGLPLIIGTVRRVRPQRGDELPGGPRARRAAGRAEHGDGGGAERRHHHRRLRQPHDRPTTRGSSASGSSSPSGPTCALIASLVVLPVALRMMKRHPAPAMADPVSTSSAA